MSMIDDVYRLAATERDIHRLERQIAFLSSLSDADIGKAWPQIVDQVGNMSQCAELDESRSKIEASRRMGFLALRHFKTLFRLEHHERRLFRSLVLTTALVLLTAAQFSTYVGSGRSKLVAANSGEEQVVEQLDPTSLNTDASTTTSGTREFASSVKVSGIRTRSRPETSPLVGKRMQEDQWPTAKFVVTGASFVRAKPSSQAAILAVLEPGTEIEVLDRRRNYFRIRVIRAQRVSGFIHREDAFFKPIG